MSNASDFVIENGVLTSYKGNDETVEIPEGVKEIGDEAFCRYSGLEKIILPKSLVKIGNAVFRKCENLTIHAHAGSYAETYAKENNIPFVAE